MRQQTMHIYEGVLTAAPFGREIIASGWAATAAGTLLGLRRLETEQLPRAAVLSAAFFVASSIHLPLGITAEHLTLTGLMGVILGWVAFPAIVVGLLLQAVLFGMGGPAVLGVNTLIMAGPAVICGAIFRKPLMQTAPAGAAIWGFAAGASAIALCGLANGLCLILAGKEYWWFAGAMAIAHLPLAIAEGMITASAVALLRQVRPDFFGTLTEARCSEIGDA